VDQEHLLTPGEVAALFRVDPKTVTRWATAGRISSIRTPGGHRRFRETEVAALLSGQPAARSILPMATPALDSALPDDVAPTTPSAGAPVLATGIPAPGMAAAALPGLVPEQGGGSMDASRSIAPTGGSPVPA